MNVFYCEGCGTASKEHTSDFLCDKCKIEYLKYENKQLKKQLSIECEAKHKYKQENEQLKRENEKLLKDQDEKIKIRDMHIDALKKNQNQRDQDRRDRYICAAMQGVINKLEGDYVIMTSNHNILASLVADVAKACMLAADKEVKEDG